MAHDVFVSYASGDKVTADAVVATLERGGVRCWVAPRDVTPGDKWADAIVRAISGGRVMVLVFSSGANASQHIIREVELAAEHHVPVIPLRVENVVPCPNLDYYIAGTHWLDAIDPPLEAHLERLTVVVGALLTSATGTGPGGPASVGSTERGETIPAPPPPPATPMAPAAASVLSPPKPPTTESIPEVPSLRPETVATQRPARRHAGIWVGAIAAAFLVVAVLAIWLLRSGGTEGETDRQPSAGAAAPSVPGDPAVEQPNPSGPLSERVGAPTQLRVARATPLEVKLVWKQPQSGGEVDHFLVFRDGKRIGGKIDERSFVDENVRSGTTYRYRVVAIGVDGSQASTDARPVNVPAIPSSPDTPPSSDTPGTPGDNGPPACDGVVTPSGECIPWN